MPPDNLEEMAEILLVEPNPADTRLFTENLRGAQFTNNIHAVTDGESALDFVYQRGDYSEVPSPDIILLDPQLPGKSGSDVLAELKNENALRDIPVVILTSSQAGTEILKATELEAETYIEKPVEPDEFISFVQSVEDFWLAILRQGSQN